VWTPGASLVIVRVLLAICRVRAWNRTSTVARSPLGSTWSKGSQVNGSVAEPGNATRNAAPVVLAMVRVRSRISPKGTEPKGRTGGTRTSGSHGAAGYRVRILGPFSGGMLDPDVIVVTRGLVRPVLAEAVHDEPDRAIRRRDDPAGCPTGALQVDARRFPGQDRAFPTA
jgi:hypothetical protein